MSEIFFIVWSTNIPSISVQIDTLIFNAVQIIINIVLIFYLIKDITPASMSPFMAELFNRDFKAFLNGRQFLHFMKYFDLIKANKAGTYLCRADTVFNCIYYVAKVNPKFKLCITSSDSSYKIKDVVEGSWIGIIEYTAFDEQLGKKIKLKEITGKSRRFDVLWGINCFVEEISEKDKNYPKHNLKKEMKHQEINNIGKEEELKIKEDLAKLNKDDINPSMVPVNKMPNANIEVLNKDNEFSKVENQNYPISNEEVDGVLLYRMDIDVYI